MAARKWTESQKARQRALIQTWKPWQKSTGATTKEGKAISSQNALKEGIYTAESLQSYKEIRALDRKFRERMREIDDRLDSLIQYF